MTAYIVGMIVGGLVTVFPLIYMMNFDMCVAEVLQEQPEFSVATFSPAYSPALASSITAVGAVVLLVSVGMLAIRGLHGMKTNPDQPTTSGPQGASEEPDAGEALSAPDF